ncbi:MAG: hypothetical protein ACRD1N_09170 [Terriglobia bacterium]
MSLIITLAGRRSSTRRERRRSAPAHERRHPIIAILAALSLELALSGMAGAATGSGWIEVRNPHFVVISNALPPEARQVAERFERVRAVFEKAFPTMREYPGLPIRVFAASGQASFEALEPAAWQQSGEIAHAGMLLRNADRAYILLRLGLPGDNPYRVVYHEYAHLMLGENFPSIPLWLNEGLSEFYSDSDLDRKTVWLGLPSRQDLTLLRAQPLLPLQALFAAGASSPYYNERGKGTIFYAESWALVDYLMFLKTDPATGRGPIDNYLQLIAEGAEPVAAGARAFGDLTRLQNTLAAFVQRRQFHYYRLKVNQRRPKSPFSVIELNPADAAAIRGDFLVRVGREAEARSLLTQALQADPGLAGAQQGMGLLEMRQHHPALAQGWFDKAASASPRAYLARYYQALAMMRSPSAAEMEQRITSDVNALLSVNPAYAPADAALAYFYARLRNHLDRARQLAARASQLDPHNVDYKMLEADILLAQSNAAAALKVAQQAIAQAQTPAEKSRAYVLLGTIQARAAARQGR